MPKLSNPICLPVKKGHQGMDKARRLSRSLVAVLSAVGLTFAAGCGGGGSSTEPGGTQPSIAANAELRDMLPAEIKKSGTLTIATDATIGAPFASYATDNKTIVGLAPDLAQALGQTLGVKVQLQHTTFANLIPGLTAGRFDFSVAPMLDTQERQQQVSFVDYLRGGSAFLVKRDGGRPDLTLEALCGLAVGFTAGSVEEKAATEQSQKCVEQGKAPVKLHAFQTNNEGVLAAVSGRVDTFITAAAQGGYIAKQDSGRVTQSGKPFRGGLSAMAFPKDSELTKVVHATLQFLIQSGKYGELLRSYGLETLAVEAATINTKVVS